MFERTVACSLRRRRLRVVAPLWAGIALSWAMTLFSAPTSAAEVRLLSAAAMQSVFKDLAGEFERTSGHTLRITYAAMGAITQRVLDGETADLVIGSGPSIAVLVEKGKLRPESQFMLSKLGVGAVVPTGTAKPAFASVEDVKRAFLGARVVIYANPEGGGAAGIHVARVIERLGIAEQLKTKTQYGAGGDVTEVTLATGQGAFSLTQISEIVNKAGAELVGPLPAELQNYTIVAAGIPVGAAQSEATAALLAFLRNPRAVGVFKVNGHEVD